MKKVAILGLGRSGLALAKAVRSGGAEAVVFDRAPRENLSLAHQLDEIGAELRAGFDDLLPQREFDTLITSPGVDMRSPILKEAKLQGVDVIGEIEFAYRIAKAPIVAITGSNGKSTTTCMTWCALQATGAKPVLCGNIYGSGYDEMPLTEAALNSIEDQILVAEISSFQLEWVRDFRPRAAAITNITPDHLNRYDSFEQYAATKRRLFDRMADGDVIVANAGDPSTYPTNESLRDRGAGHPSVRFYGAAGVDASFDSQHLKLAIREPIGHLPFQERHNLLNATCAALLAGAMMEDHVSASELAERILEGLKGFKPLAHRMEKVGSRDGIEVINNSMCTNPAALVASSQGIAAHQHLLMGGVKKEYSFAPVKEHLDRVGHRAYLFGRDAQEISAELGGNYPVFVTMEEAFTVATEQAKPGDAIMLAPGCASQDQFTHFADRGERFRKIAMEWLKDEAKP